MPAQPAQALGHDAPVWPLPDIPKRVATFGGLAFGAPRKKGLRHHAGVDLIAPRGTIVVAPEAGTVVATQRFNGPNAYALLLQTHTDPVILLGEVEPGSWNEFGAYVGSRVERGEPIARVGINPGGSTMLHLEMYEGGTERNHQWMKGRAPPPQLLDPTLYLTLASAGEPIDTVPMEDPDEGLAEEPAQPVHEPGAETMPNDVEFDPITPTEGVTWADRTMTPADADAYWQAGYEPRDMWRPDQVVCAQDGGTYYPGQKCLTSQGQWCDSVDYMTGKCTPVAPVDVGDDIAPELIPELIPEIVPDIIAEQEHPGDIPMLPVPGPDEPGAQIPWWWAAIAIGVLVFAVSD